MQKSKEKVTKLISLLKWLKKYHAYHFFSKLMDTRQRSFIAEVTCLRGGGSNEYTHNLCFEQK